MVRESLASDRTRAVSQVGGVHTVGGARFAASAQSSAALMAIRDAPMSCGKLVPSVTRLRPPLNCVPQLQEVSASWQPWSRCLN